MIDILEKTNVNAPPMSIPRSISDSMPTSKNPIPKAISVGGTTGVIKTVNKMTNIAFTRFGILLELVTGIDMIKPRTLAKTNPAVNKMVIT